jgi:ABC-type Zn uptake system ZnuABC Zn-binding protein ZnuA
MQPRAHGRRRPRPRPALLAFLALACSSPGAAAPASVAAEAGSLGWADELTGGDDRLDVTTTVAPISSIVRNIGGTRIRLRGIVPDATNSHTFEPSPSDARTLASADLIVANGLNLEEPTLRLAEVSKRSEAGVVLLGDAALTPDEWIFDFSFPASQGDPNPHVWMSVPYAVRYAELVRDALADADPANADYYGENLERYTERLDALDAAIRQLVPTVSEENRRLLTYHDSWAYWAREYGFEVIGAVQASDFSEPSPREVARLIEQIRAERVPAVFGSEVFPSDVLEQIARESGARYVDELRDDEPPGGTGSAPYTYLGMMQRDMIVMFEALGGRTDAFEALDVTNSHLP